MNKREFELFKKDLLDKRLYFTYVKTKVRMAEDFALDELEKFHTAYVKLSDSFGKFSGAEFTMYVAKLIDSNLSHDEKYDKYKKYISDCVVQYNKAYALKKQLTVD